MTTFFKFSPLALAAHQALKPTAPQPQADPDPEQSRAAISQIAQALAVGETEADQAHEQVEEVVVQSARPAVEVPVANDNTAQPIDNVSDPSRASDGVGDASLENRRLAILIGSRIRAAREANGVSQGGLAKAIGHAKQTQPSLWEAGKRLAPISELPGLAKALDTSADFLLGLTDDMDADPSAARRGLLVQHLRDQLEAVAGSLADVALESGLELEGSLRTSKLLTLCDHMQRAVHRFKAANAEAFDDLPAGALLIRSAQELASAAVTVGAELDGVGQRRERAARAAREAMATGVR